MTTSLDRVPFVLKVFREKGICWMVIAIASSILTMFCRGVLSWRLYLRAEYDPEILQERRKCPGHQLQKFAN